VSMRMLLVLGVVGLTAFGALGADQENTIKDVMKQAHDRQAELLGKVTGGNASKEEKEQLQKLYEDLAKNKPPKGAAQAWKSKTDAMVAAAKSVVKGDQGAEVKLKNTVNCMACHNAHRAN